MKRLLQRASAVAVGVFYRVKHLGGAVPAEGPVILVGNHPNGLVDAVMVAEAAGRDVHLLGKATLFDVPLLGRVIRGFGMLPVYRSQDGSDTAMNERTFEAVWDALDAGEAICLFPEGISHSEPALQRLKTGAARMALGAEARSGFALGVRVVPVGLVYAAKHRFRSRAAAWIGEAIDARGLAGEWALDDREAVRRLTERIEVGLRAVTVNLDRWEDLPLIELAERIWKPARGPRRVERLAALAEAARAVRARHPERMDDLRERVRDFGLLLGRFGLRADDLDVEYGPTAVVRFAARQATALVIGLPLAAAGALVWALPYGIVRAVPALTRPAADVAATHKLLAALVFYPLWWLALGAAAGSWLDPLAAAPVLLAAPVLGLFAISFWERGRAAAADSRAFLRHLSSRGLKRRLVERRNDLAERIEALDRLRAAEGLGGDVPGPPGAGDRRT